MKNKKTQGCCLRAAAVLMPRQFGGDQQCTTVAVLCRRCGRPVEQQRLQLLSLGALKRCRRSYFLKGEIGAVSTPPRADEALQAFINVCSGLSVLSWTNINMLRLRACLGAGGWCGRSYDSPMAMKISLTFMEVLAEVSMNSKLLSSAYDCASCTRKWHGVNVAHTAQRDKYGDVCLSGSTPLSVSGDRLTRHSPGSPVLSYWPDQPYSRPELLQCWDWLVSGALSPSSSPAQTTPGHPNRTGGREERVSQ